MAGASKPWFAPKRFGYGAGLPISWEGWAVLFLFLLGVVASSVMLHGPWRIGVVMALIDISMMGTLKFVDQGKLAYNIGFPIATLLYAFEPYVFLKAMAHSNMLTTNLIWNLASNILVTLAGVFFFKEDTAALRICSVIG